MWKSFYRVHRKQLRTTCMLLIIGLAYYALTQLMPFRIPCVFQKITGLACPGCGVTHFCIRLLHLDFRGAAKENLALACILPPWGLLLLIRTILHPRWLRKNGKLKQGFYWGCIAVLLVFGVVRNLPGFSFLLPSYLQ
ncbi:MAG: DUF2752 domain-containing protein [Ruminococcus sp.]|nr:DUF2752 domain-containing protein [Ruminococcus sp.]